jgi:hypothetical protein
VKELVDLMLAKVLTVTGVACLVAFGLLAAVALVRGFLMFGDLLWPRRRRRSRYSVRSRVRQFLGLPPLPMKGIR